MITTQTSRRDGAFTLVEMLVVIAIIGILAALLMPALSQGKARAQRIQCVGNLKQAGIAFHVFAHDHHGHFPMQVSALAGGSEEFIQSGYHVGGEFYFSFRHFQPLAKELGSTKLLVCPADLARLPAANFARLNNINLSYLVGVNAQWGSANSVLSGDRNLTNDWGGSPTILQAGPGSLIRWTGELHHFKGNLLFADGHVDELNGLRLAQNQNASGVLFLPSTKQPGASAASPGNNSLAIAQNSSTGGARSNPGQTNGSADIGRQTPATNRSHSLKNVTAASPLAVTRLAPPSPDSVENTKLAKVETNSAGVATQGSPTRTALDDGGSPFMRWFADMAKQIVDWAKWLLWLLLLLLLIALVALRLRQLAWRKNK